MWNHSMSKLIQDKEWSIILYHTAGDAQNSTCENVKIM